MNVARAVLVGAFVAAATGMALVATTCGPGSGPSPAPAFDFDDTYGGPTDPVLHEAIRQRVEAVRRTPDDAVAWANLAMTYEIHEMWKPAEQCLARALELDPTRTRWRWFRAVALEATDRFDEALAEARAVLEKEPGYAPAHATVARWHLTRGRLDDALASARAATAADAQDAGAWIVLAQVLLERGDDAEAERAARRALSGRIASREQLAFAHFTLGRALQALGRGEEARRAAARGRDGNARAAIADPWSYELGAYRVGFRDLMYAAHAALEGRDVETARAILEDLRRRDPDHVQVAIDLGRAYRELGLLAESAAVLDHGIAKHPDSPALRVERARLHEAQGDEPGALRELAAAAERNPSSGEAFEARGMLHLRRDRRMRAIADFEEALRREPTRAWVLVHAGVAYLEDGDVAGADAAFRRCIEADPGIADAYAGLAIVAARLGDRNEGLRQLAISRSLEPTETALQEAAREETSGR